MSATSSARAALSVSYTTIGFRCVVDVCGDVELTTVGTLDAALDMVLHSSERDIWIDLARVTFLDTTGLHALRRVRPALDRDHRRLVIICPPGPIARVFELTGLDREFALLPDRMSAQRFS